MKKAIIAFDDLLGSVELLILMIAMLLMLICVSSNVLTRIDAVGHYISNLNDLALMSMAVAAFVGAAYSTYSQNHISIDLVPRSSSAALQRSAHVIRILALFALPVAVCWLSYSFFSVSLLFGEVTSEMQLPISIPSGALFAAMIAMIFHNAVDALRFFGFLPPRVGHHEVIEL